MALLDEARVRQMSNGGTRGPVVVTRGDVLTPSARSWLREHRVEVVFPQGEPEKTDGGRQEKGGAARYRTLFGAELHEKPEHMTHLKGNVLVFKDHPRIAFRGWIDALEAEILLTQQAAAGEGYGALAGELEKINAKHLDSRIDLPATQKELRALAQAINAMLDRINKAYSAQMRFVSDASHELRTPIAVIQGYAALLDRWGKDDPATRQEAIDAIRQEADSMKELVEQLLFLARGDNDTQPVKPVAFDLTVLAGEVLREEEMIHQDRVFLPRLGEAPIPVRADQGLIKQVMRILMDNSVKYSPPDGRVYLRVTAQEGYARVTVQDEGMGIAPQGIPHIFDRFYRTDQSRDRRTGGTGLGLSIAKWIVDRHGGWFEVVSREGVGTRISFLLPSAPASTEEEAV